MIHCFWPVIAQNIPLKVISKFLPKQIDDFKFFSSNKAKEKHLILRGANRFQRLVAKLHLNPLVFKNWYIEGRQDSIPI